MRFSHPKRGLRRAIPALLLACARLAGQEPPAAPAPPASLVRSPEDGRLDLSAFLDQAYGFLPVVMPITEPAVGYGAAFALAFLDKPVGKAEAGLGRPNVTVVGAVTTENGTRGLLVGDLRHWSGDRVQTLVGAVRASINLDFYGLDSGSALAEHPLRYNLDTAGALARVRVRLGESRFWLGLEYDCAGTEVGLQAPERWPQGPGYSSQSRIGGLCPALSLDTRDNMFTPSSGSSAELELGYFRKALGGDANFQRHALRLMQYFPLRRDLVLALRGDALASSGDVPFYMRPFIVLRGAPLMRYQGREVAFAESELRWQRWGRFSLVGFLGTGSAWKERDSAEAARKESILTGGAGFRYELARRYGIHAGLDLAHGPEGYAIYIQVGSAWMRP